MRRVWWAQRPVERVPVFEIRECFAKQVDFRNRASCKAEENEGDIRDLIVPWTRGRWQRGPTDNRSAEENNAGRGRRWDISRHVSFCGRSFDVQCSVNTFQIESMGSLHPRDSMRVASPLSPPLSLSLSLSLSVRIRLINRRLSWKSRGSSARLGIRLAPSWTRSFVPRAHVTACPVFPRGRAPYDAVDTRRESERRRSKHRRDPSCDRDSKGALCAGIWCCLCTAMAEFFKWPIPQHWGNGKLSALPPLPDFVSPTRYPPIPVVRCLVSRNPRQSGDTWKISSERYRASKSFALIGAASSALARRESPKNMRKVWGTRTGTTIPGKFHLTDLL